MTNPDPTRGPRTLTTTEGGPWERHGSSVRTIGTAAHGGWGKGPRKHPNGRRQVPNFDSAGRHEFRRPPAAAWGRRGQQNQGPAESKLGGRKGEERRKKTKKEERGGGESLRTPSKDYLLLQTPSLAAWGIRKRGNSGSGFQGFRQGDWAPWDETRPQTARVGLPPTRRGGYPFWPPMGIFH